MGKYLQIQVTKPCQEEWENMQSTNAGSFCNSCRKTVIDFTVMNNEQLIAWFKNKPQNICGRFYDDQLDQRIAIPAKQIPWLRYFFQVTIPAMLWGSKAIAQQVQKNHKEIVVLAEKKPSVLLRGDITVTGTITGFQRELLAGATVMISGSNRAVAADSIGRYSIKLSGNERCLEFSRVGYEKKLLEITATVTDVQLNLPISTNLLLNVTVGTTIRRVTMGGAGSSVYTINLLHKDLPAKKTVYAADLFPNPVKRNSLLRIRWKNPVFNDQQIIIFNAAGIKLAQKTIYINQSTTLAQMDLNLNAAGYYIIHITDSRTHDKQVTTLIVE